MPAVRWSWSDQSGDVVSRDLVEPRAVVRKIIEGSNQQLVPIASLRVELIGREQLVGMAVWIKGFDPTQPSLDRRPRRRRPRRPVRQWLNEGQI